LFNSDLSASINSDTFLLFLAISIILLGKFHFSTGDSGAFFIIFLPLVLIVVGHAGDCHLGFTNHGQLVNCFGFATTLGVRLSGILLLLVPFF
jgi:hypothetical protein